MSENYQKNYFAVIDTETNWSNQVMSIGLVIANNETFSIVEKKYYIITPECNEGGMYSSVLSVKGQKEDLKGPRKDVLQAVESTLSLYNVDSIYAYNQPYPRIICHSRNNRALSDEQAQASEHESSR